MTNHKLHQIIHLCWHQTLSPCLPPQPTEHSRRRTAQRQTLGTTVRRWVELAYCLFTCSLTFVFMPRASRWPEVLSHLRKTANCRTETVTADMPLCRRRRRTWRCSGGEGSFISLSSANYTADGLCENSYLIIHGAVTLLPWVFQPQILHLISPFNSALCLPAGTLWTSCWRLREPTWRSCSACCRCSFTPLSVYSSLALTCVSTFMCCFRVLAGICLWDG